MTIRLDFLLLGTIAALAIAFGTPGCSRHTAVAPTPAEAPPVAATPAPEEPAPIGEEHPFDPGHDETAWAKNRRAQFEVKQAILSGAGE